jgi:hypothetical protein
MSPFLRTVVGLLAVGLVPLAATPRVSAAGPKTLAACTYNSQFPQAHDTYNAMGVAADGKVYYVLSAELIDVGARMYCFDPATKKIRCLGDLTEICGEKGLKAVCQGKSHVNFVQAGSKLYFATHVGYYSIIDGMERMPIPPAGFQPYPGGHVLSYDTATGRFDDLARAPGGEGVLTLNMDPQRGRIYCLSWPKGHFFRVDVARREVKDFGILAGQGEDGRGKQFYTICRSIAVDPRDGSAYFTLSTGAIMRYRCDRDCVECVAGENLRKDYFGLYDPHSAGHMGYNWRVALWHPGQQVFYGVHGNSGYLFRFDPREPRVELVQRITSEPSQRSGMFDQFSYGYLGFALGPDRHTIYYLTGGPVYEHGKRVAGKASTAKGESKGIENLHLVTYDTANGKYADHGAIFFADGQRPYYVNSIAVGHDATVYFLSRITQHGHTRTDLVSVRP